MAHELEINAEGIASMAYVAEHGAPWHQLGQPVAMNLTPDEMAAAANMNWDVELRPVCDETGSIVLPEKKRLVRVSDNKTFDIVGQNWTPLQNLDAVRFFREFVEAGDMTMETAGALFGGQTLWAQARLKEDFELAGGDKVNGHLVITWSHKWGTAIVIKFVQERVVCHNTLSWALTEKGAQWTATHAQDFASLKEEAMRSLQLAGDHRKAFQQQAEALAAVKVSQEQTLRFAYIISESWKRDEANEESGDLSAGEVIATLMQADKNILDAANGAAKAAKSLTENDLNRSGRAILSAILTSPGSDMASAQGTAWGLVNGATYHFDHEGGRNNEQRFISSLNGQRAEKKQRALELALQIAGVSAN